MFYVTRTGRNDWYRLTRYLEIGLMQVTDIARQNPTSSSSASVDCDSIHKEHSLKRVREEEGDRSFEKRETTLQSGGEVVGEVEEKGEKAVDHNSSPSLTGTCTPHCLVLPCPFLFSYHNVITLVIRSPLLLY